MLRASSTCLRRVDLSGRRISPTIFSVLKFSDIASPSTKTTVILNKLPSSVTQSSLINAFEGLDYRKVELQPGFALHVTNEPTAEKIISILNQKYNSEVIFEFVTI